MKAVIYARVSSIDGSQNTDRQVADLKLYAKDNQLEVVKVFIDEISATKKGFDERLSFNLMNDYIERNNIKHILVSELSRISRKLKDSVNFIEDCTLKKINIHIQKDKLRTLREDGTKDSMAQVIITMLSSFAQLETDTLSDRIRSGKANAIKQGGDFNGKIYGYKADENKRPIINEEEAPLVQQIFKMLLEGIGPRKIATYLNENYETKNWRDATVHTMVRNSFYCGKRKYKGQTLDVPPIITEEVFREANEFLDSRKRFDKNKIYINPFASFIKCKCGSVMYQIKQRSNRIDAYKCSSKCGVQPVNRPFLIREIRMIVENNAKILKDKEFRGRLKLAIDSNIATIKINDTEIRKLKKKLEFLFEKWMEEKISEEQYNTSSNKYTFNIKSLESENINLLKANRDIEQSLEQEILHYSDDLNVFKTQLLKVIGSIQIDKLEAEVNLKTGTTAIIKIYRGHVLQRYNKYLKDNGNTIDFEFDINSYYPEEFYVN
jgi:DNA invertase Pin-like site-specific DNA recombinase